MTKQVVAVLGGTGLQGGGVVDALTGAGKFAVRVASRNPASDAARALAARGVEVVKADLLDPSTLRSALEGAHGAFVVTNFWDPAQMPRETEIGTAAVQAARAAGVKHLIWSTLPDSEKLTGGRIKGRNAPAPGLRSCFETAALRWTASRVLAMARRSDQCQVLHRS